MTPSTSPFISRSIPIAGRTLALRRAAAAGAALAALFGSASAMALTITFSGGGAVTGAAQTPPLLTDLMLSSATSAYTFGSNTGWSVDKVFSFNVATLTGAGTFTFSNGSSSLTGTFTSSRLDTASPTVLVYSVTAGTGAFAGYTGSGLAEGFTTGNPFSLPTGPVSFSESGAFDISPVPEPASALLFGLGLAGVLLRRSQAAPSRAG